MKTMENITIYLVRISFANAVKQCACINYFCHTPCIHIIASLCP